jgi:transcriptional regulator with XRE-family HTH domain|tara:strand:+ start:773 stop:1048 length:276 start_codon:yes stop_codon:yes gene_type:complete
MEVQRMLLDIEKRKEVALHLTKLANDYAYYTLADACRDTGESYSAIRRILRSPNPTVVSLSRVAKVLNVTLDWLLTGEVTDPSWRSEHEEL